MGSDKEKVVVKRRPGSKQRLDRGWVCSAVEGTLPVGIKKRPDRGEKVLFKIRTTS